MASIVDKQNWEEIETDRGAPGLACIITVYIDQSSSSGEGFLVALLKINHCSSSLGKIYFWPDSISAWQAHLLLFLLPTFLLEQQSEYP